LAFSVVYKSSVARDLKKLGKKEARKLLDRIEKDLSKKPDAQPVLKGEFAGLRRYRVGDHRVIYAILDKEIVILRIRHRKDAYRRPV
jgi:mRNA interferase RelE/StbE